MSGRRYIALLLILAFAGGLAYQTTTILHFYVYRAEITAKYCVNKDKPQLNCHGQCHLKKQLSRPVANAESTSTNRENLSFWLFAVELPARIVCADRDGFAPFLGIYQKILLTGFSEERFSPPDMIL